MHLYILTRGIKRQVDKFQQDMAAQWCKHKWKEGDKIVEGHVELGMRPLQLWEIVFPKASLPDVLANLRDNSWGTLNPIQQAVIRNAVGARKLKDIEIPSKEYMRKFFVKLKDVETLIIGAKDDTFDESGIERL